MTIFLLTEALCMLHQFCIDLKIYECRQFPNFIHKTWKISLPASLIFDTSSRRNLSIKRDIPYPIVNGLLRCLKQARGALKRLWGIIDDCKQQSFARHEQQPKVTFCVFYSLSLGYCVNSCIEVVSGYVLYSNSVDCLGFAFLASFSFSVSKPSFSIRYWQFSGA